MIKNCIHAVSNLYIGQRLRSASEVMKTKHSKTKTGEQPLCERCKMLEIFSMKREGCGEIPLVFKEMKDEDSHLPMSRQWEEVGRAPCSQGWRWGSCVIRGSAELSGLESFERCSLTWKSKEIFKGGPGQMLKKICWVKIKRQRLGFTGLLNDTTQGQGCVALDEGTHEWWVGIKHLLSIRNCVSSG